MPFSVGVILLVRGIARLGQHNVYSDEVAGVYIDDGAARGGRPMEAGATKKYTAGFMNWPGWAVPAP